MPDPIITRAREILSTPDKWTKGVHARDADNREISPFAPEATCFCIDGALLRAAAEATGRLEALSETADLDAIDSVSRGPAYIWAATKLNCLTAGYVEFNDRPETTFADVRSTLDQVARA